MLAMPQTSRLFHDQGTKIVTTSAPKAGGSGAPEALMFNASASWSWHMTGGVPSRGTTRGTGVGDQAGASAYSPGPLPPLDSYPRTTSTGQWAWRTTES